MTIDLDKLKRQALALTYLGGSWTAVPLNPEKLTALIEVAEAALAYEAVAAFVYFDHASEQAGRRLEQALAPFKEPA